MNDSNTYTDVVTRPQIVASRVNNCVPREKRGQCDTHGGVNRVAVVA